MSENASQVDDHIRPFSQRELTLLIEGNYSLMTTALSSKDTLGALEAAATIGRLSNLLLSRLAEAAHEEGASWQQIGNATGKTRQAAQQRWAARKVTGVQTETLDLEEPATEQPATEQPATPKAHTIVRAPGEKGGPDGVIGSADRWWLYCNACGAVPETMRTREEARSGRRAHLRDVHGQEVEK